jgi:isopropylmalate/homocitrate/citramalate synthase
VKKKKTIQDLYSMKEKKEPITFITSYDYPTATFAEKAGMDMILVGDSLDMCVYGYEGTMPVTMDQMIVHSEAVRRGAPNTMVIGDMPFLSYQGSDERAVENAGRFFKEARADAVKLEGGMRVVSWVRHCRDENPLELGPFVPSLVGQRPIEIVMGKSSGVDSVADWMERMKLDASQEQREAIVLKVKEASIRKKGLLTEEEFKKIFDSVVHG